MYICLMYVYSDAYIHIHIYTYICVYIIIDDSHIGNKRPEQCWLLFRGLQSTHFLILFEEVQTSFDQRPPHRTGNGAGSGRRARQESHGGRTKTQGLAQGELEPNALDEDCCELGPFVLDLRQLDLGFGSTRCVCVCVLLFFLSHFFLRIPPWV